MGDHRMSIKIDAKFHGIKRKVDMWINYCPDEENMDNRVVDFFKEIYEEGMDKYYEQMEKIEEIKNKEQAEKEERALLEKLKNKYEKS